MTRMNEVVLRALRNEADTVLECLADKNLTPEARKEFGEDLEYLEAAIEKLEE